MGHVDRKSDRPDADRPSPKERALVLMVIAGSLTVFWVAVFKFFAAAAG